MYSVIKSPDTQKNYQRLVSAIGECLAQEDDFISGLSNVSAFIMAYLDALNWAGFYLLRGQTLVLGPFQGLPACTRIALGSGVCGTAAAERRNVRVMDVNEFAGHIACDSASNSELVLPFYRGGQVCGVLDLDSPEKARFTETDERFLDEVARLLDAFAERTI